MIYLQLFWEFFKIGLFAVGGGMATLPFLERLASSSGWFGHDLIIDMIAVSEATPGPIGINMATYVGCNVAGVGGGIVATLGEVLPAVLIVTAVSRSLEKFRGSRAVEDAFYGLRPAVTGLIAAAGIGVMEKCIFTLDAYALSGSPADLVDIRKVVFFVLVFIGVKKLKWHPTVFIAISALVGIALQF